MDGAWKGEALEKIIKSYKNKALSGEHAVATGDVFCSYLHKGHQESQQYDSKGL